MSKPLHFFHGTTRKAADQIRAQGWQVRDLPGMVGELAARHKVPLPDVLDDLRRYKRFMVIEKDRGQVASLAPTYEAAAGSWAQRAPEVEWDALWAIWRVKHSGEKELYHWNLDVPGHAWVLEQMTRYEPAIVEIALTLEELFKLGAKAGGFASGLLTPEDVPHLADLPEVSIPLPFQPSTGVIVHDVERRVGWDVFAHCLGVTKKEFIARQRSGSFGPSGEGEFETRPWWPLSTVRAVLGSVEAGIPL